MKKTINIKHEFSEMIPNRAGIPCTNADSEKLRKEHDHWRKEINKNRCKNFSGLLYWEKISVCTAL